MPVILNAASLRGAGLAGGEEQRCGEVLLRPAAGRLRPPAGENRPEAAPRQLAEGERPAGAGGHGHPGQQQEKYAFLEVGAPELAFFSLSLMINLTASSDPAEF